MEAVLPALKTRHEVQHREQKSVFMSANIRDQVSNPLLCSGAKIRVDNVHYDLSEGDLQVSV